MTFRGRMALLRLRRCENNSADYWFVDGAFGEGL
jgi:hypothetical protein